jgi:AcrR family transcriptional regulator
MTPSARQPSAAAEEPERDPGPRRPNPPTLQLTRNPSPVTEGPAWQDRAVARSLERARAEATERSRRILWAAMELAEESPTGDFTLQAVAERVGISIRTFYQHFPSKDDVLVAMFEEAQLDGVRRIRRQVDMHTEPLARLRSAVVSRQEIVDRSSARTRRLVQHHFLLQETHPEELRHALEPVAWMFRELVADAADAGAITVADVDKATNLLLLTVTTAIQSSVLGSAPLGDAPTPEEVWEFCLQGLHGNSKGSNDCE